MRTEGPSSAVVLEATVIRSKNEIADRSRTGVWDGVAIPEPEGIDATLSAFFAAAPSGVALLDNQLRFLKINDALCSLSGKPANEHLGHRIVDTFPDAGLDKLSRRVLETGEPENNLRLEIPSHGGAVCSLDTSLFPIFGSNGEACAVGIIVVDVTDRERIADHLREREAQFHALADNIPQLAWMADGCGSIFWYNQRWYDYTGGNIGDGHGRGWVRYHHPETVDQVVARIEHSFVTGVIWEDTFRLRGANGEYRWFLSRATPIRDGNGRVVRWFGTNTDVTEQRLLDEATAHLSESIEPETTFPKVARVAIPTLADFCFFDLLEDDKLRRVAWAHVDPVREAAWAGRVINLVPDLSAREHPVVMALVSGETILEPELTPDWFDENRSLTCEQRSFYETIGFNSVIVAPLRVGDRILGALSLGYCGTPRRSHTIAQKQLAEELARRAALAIDNARHYEAARTAVQAGEQVLAMVSHDLRNPLSTIELAISTMLEDEAGAPLRKQLQIARRATTRMAGLIADLLDAASIQAGKLSVDIRRESAGELIDEVFEAHLARAADKKLEFVADHSLAHVLVRCDRARMLQALGNLVGNAIKFCRAGDRIGLRGRLSGRDVMIDIEDTGPGIPAGEVPHLFDRYWAVARGTQRGTGLGLFITKRIVEAHRGTISVDTTPGVGSTFRIALPRQ
jgi:PAS domain S-box-containing protein